MEMHYVCTSVRKELHTNGPAPYNHGICTQVSEHLTIQERGYMLYLMRQWPERSGSINWPVPASLTDTSTKAAKVKYVKSSTKQMWDRDTEYGQLRLELLDWLIEELQK